MDNVNRLTYGAILLAIFAVLLFITLYVPFIGALVNLYLPLPFILFASKYDNKSTVLFFIASIIISIITGKLFAIPLAIIFGMTGLVMGILIKASKNKFTIFVYTTLVFLLNLVVAYVISIAFFKINFIKDSIQLFELSLQNAESIQRSLGQQPNEQMIERFELGLKMIDAFIPSIFVLSSLLIVYFIIMLNNPIIKRLGMTINKWKPFREIVLPRSILWYYLLTLILSIILKPEIGSYIYVALVNLSFMLQFLLIVQGVSLLHYFCYIKGWSKSIAVVITILILFIPILLYIVRILGIIDLGFDLRKRIEQIQK